MARCIATVERCPGWLRQRGAVHARALANVHDDAHRCSCPDAGPDSNRCSRPNRRPEA